MTRSSNSLHSPLRETGLRREGILFVSGTISSLAREADNLQHELAVLKQEIAEIEHRLKYVAEHWECRKLPRSNGYSVTTF
jgi:hypothetical protein